MIDNWGELSALLTANAYAKGIPLTGEFELTPRCNLSCQMCYICKNAGDNAVIKQELKARDWIKLGEAALQAGTLFIQLTGGEIFIKEDFKEIYEEYAKMGFNISLNTNGTLITPKVASWIGNIPPSQMDITLYGASRETYAKVCGNPDGFDHTLRGISLLLEQGINLQLRTTIIQSNIGDYEQMQEIANGFDLDLGIVNYISPRRDDNLKSPKDIRLSPKDLAAFERRIFGSGVPINEESKAAFEIVNNFDLSKLEIASALSEDAVFPCSSGKLTYWVTWDGRMIPCPNMNQPVTYPLKEGLLSAWNRLKILCNTIPGCSECKVCSYKEQCCSCPANLYGETGFYDKPAQYLCELARERANT
jgi:MoaA/NifB/PqqE/SkfB family radical SAM enzyme